MCSVMLAVAVLLQCAIPSMLCWWCCVLQNVRKLIDAASDTSLASACLGLAMDVGMDPRLSPAMAGAWRLYRESDVDTVRGLTCGGTIFKSGIRLVDLLTWASKYGSNTILVPNNAEERSGILRGHLVAVTWAAVESEELVEVVSDTVKRLWTEWFGVLMPDVNAREGSRLPMVAYVMLASDSLQPKANWPRQLQARARCALLLGACESGVFPLMCVVTCCAVLCCVLCVGPTLCMQAMCRVYNRTSTNAEVNSFLEAVPDVWAQLRLPTEEGVGWRHPMAERLLCSALACPKLSPAAQLSLLQVSKTGGPLSLPDSV